MQKATMKYLCILLIFLSANTAASEVKLMMKGYLVTASVSEFVATQELVANACHERAGIDVGATEFFQRIGDQLEIANSIRAQYHAKGLSISEEKFGATFREKKQIIQKKAEENASLFAGRPVQQLKPACEGIKQALLDESSPLVKKLKERLLFLETYQSAIVAGIQKWQ